ncbi:hypothetical protein OQ968_02635 [Mycobacterium sp. 663a-19]|uniref:hypothetical protein n=1 Tax=Mycobacterium sp. 663a-19 TaxID=2986148 RepID=UPI002D1ED01D|nr:hypothetical protein [Mycobacterium sp. 663a-19]MEB3980156.1 hypothetical protein [Mycobacterium sp. 663a-19]
MPEENRIAQTQHDIRAAQALPDSPDRRARGMAAQRRAREVLLDPASTPEQKSAARLALKQARALAGELDRSPAPPRTDNALRISLDIV